MLLNTSLQLDWIVGMDWITLIIEESFFYARAENAVVAVISTVTTVLFFLSLKIMVRLSSLV